MKPLIVAATRFEIEDSIPLLEEKQIPYLITGIGMTATAYALGKTLATTPATSAVLNVGIAGSFDKNISLGEVVSIRSDTFYELGAEDGDNFLSIADLGFGKYTYEANQVIWDFNLPTFEAITVNKVHGNFHSIQKVLDQIPTIKIESMEGAAVFYVCALENIPCVQIRSISNYVERRNKSAWKIDLAISNLNKWLQKFIEENY
ncbi:MAG: futalosine hydrolase [Sphingobacterium composti]|uniref:futalosine hydrolase n=1 Tax=Sphingobacterium composti TaxID=363260 RepID=UPI001358003D|nr:futalosine hydrolase [Sphingobacterium composti Ten et al. 2007 non Yoo et al. 2007]